MRQIKDMTGQKFGRLTVLHRLYNYHKKGVYWLCVCECGNLTEVNGKDLRKGNTKSCGCFRGRYPRIKKNQPRLYRIYHNMRNRCHYKKHDRYKNYGGRGIKVCDEWLNSYKSFENWALTHGYNDNLTIDRIDANGNYEPNNCKWSTKKQQSRNTTKNVYLTYNNETMIIKDWATKLNTNYATILSRYHRGWAVKECLFGKD